MGGWGDGGGEKKINRLLFYILHSELSTYFPTQHLLPHSALSTLHSALREAPSSGWGKSTVRAIAISLKLSLG
uniref:Uncharacterized protein n=1 Tax=Desertifilum tharense IPPAS B-1220 TaxID=1781255 RepID=A0ACD5GZ70_9CYAN